MPTEELGFLPITELAKRIEAKKLSPVELTNYFLERSEKLGPRFNAFARPTPEIAMAQAQAAEKEIQRGHDRTGWWNGVPLRFRFVAGRSEKSVGHEMLDLRVVLGIGRDRRRGPGGLCDWHRDLGIDYLSFGVLRRERVAPDIRARQPLRRDGPFAFDGQNRAPGALGGRLRARVCRDCRARPKRSQHPSLGQSGVHVFGVAGAKGAQAEDRLAHQCVEEDGAGSGESRRCRGKSVEEISSGREEREIAGRSV